MQLFLNALDAKEMQMSDIDMLIMDECHHTVQNHPYNVIMSAYYAVRREQQSGAAQLPQIIGLTASLGVGDCTEYPQLHYVRICANLDCECITYVQDPENVNELLRYLLFRFSNCRLIRIGGLKTKMSHCCTHDADFLQL